MGKPIDPADIRNYTQEGRRVNELVKLWHTPVSGCYWLLDYADAFCRRIGLELE